MVVVDPRWTEAARNFEHVAIQPGTDAWFLLSLLSVIVDERLHDQAFIDKWTTGAETLHSWVGSFSPESTAPITGIDPATTRRIAQAVGTARSVAVYGRTGPCTQLFGTLNNMLQDIVAIVTGNLQVPGGIGLMDQGLGESLEDRRGIRS